MSLPEAFCLLIILVICSSTDAKYLMVVVWVLDFYFNMNNNISQLVDFPIYKGWPSTLWLHNQKNKCQCSWKVNTTKI